MANKLDIIYSNQAVLRTDQIINYLLENWSEKEVKNFLEALEGFEEIVSRFPEIYPQSQTLKGFRKAVVAKQISVIYSIHKGEIRVYTLFDNRQNPKTLK